MFSNWRKDMREIMGVGKMLPLKRTPCDLPEQGRNCLGLSGHENSRPLLRS